MRKHAFAATFIVAVLIAATLVLTGFTLEPSSLGMIAAETAVVTKADLEAVATKLKEVTDKFNSKSDELSKSAETALAEVKDKGALLTETKAAVDTLLIEHTKLAKEKNEVTAKLAEAEARLSGLEQEIVRRPSNGPEARESIGARMVKDDSFKTFAASGQGARGKYRYSVQAATTSVDFPASEPSIVRPQVIPGTMPTLKQRLFVRDLIPIGQTGAPMIAWIKQTGFTNNAAVVSENTTKPESTITYDVEHTVVQTIAHLFKASKQILADFAQLRTDVDRELRYGLKYAEEQQLLLGDGTGIQLNGIVTQASAFSAEFTPAFGNRIDDIRLAILQSQLARLPATGIVMHFTDWARIELTKDQNGVYVIGNPNRLAPPSLWGLPVVETEIASFETNFLVGAFAGGAQIYDREEMNVEIATENNDDFEKNMLTIRCEERIALAVFRPEAFIYGGFTAGSGT